MTNPVLKKSGSFFMSTFSNDLIHESSPYLLQHAHNPVHWKAWKATTLAEAKKQNKLLVISIGYATCHWCHVMEEESFKDHEVAEVMNAHYVAIKVDREERPDLDQVYMNALVAISGQGGWPLNIVALPDGRPIWGTTYLPKQQWIEALNQIQKLYKLQPHKAEEYAGLLTEGVSKIHEFLPPQPQANFDSWDWSQLIQAFVEQHDTENGGENRVPKFMMPCRWNFLLRYGYQTQQHQLTDQVLLTLEKMAMGGIFDQVEGGFSRYSTDEQWHIPHFEKMLYDNAQLVSLYARAYAVEARPIFKETVIRTLDFVEQQLRSPEGGFYCALDADSINSYGVYQEGAYYTFNRHELEDALAEEFELAATYFTISDEGYWKNNQYVLRRKLSDEEFCNIYQLNLDRFLKMKTKWVEILVSLRKNKQPPALDYKILTSWNALMLQAYCDAYQVFGEQSYIEKAYEIAQFIQKNLIDPDGQLARMYARGQVSGKGFLDDYSFLIVSYISLYESTWDATWVEWAKKLTQKVLTSFSMDQQTLLSYTPKDSEPLYTSSLETTDNVLPSSNAVMAHNLFWLGTFFGENTWKERSQQMLLSVDVHRFPTSYSHWLHLAMHLTHPFYEIVCMGEEALIASQSINKLYLPHTLKAGSKEREENYYLLKNRWIPGKTMFYLCQNSFCYKPHEAVKSFIKMLTSTL